MKIHCHNPGCAKTIHSFALKLGLPGSGQSVGKDWFCSRRCYKNYLADHLIAQKRGGLRESTRRVKLGLLLVKNNLISNEQLTDALEQKSGSSQKLGEILLESGKITETELKAALSMQFGIAPINLPPHTMCKQKEDIPFKLIDQFHFVLFDFDEEAKTIAAAVYDLDHLNCLQEYFTALYPHYLSRFFLEDKKKILSLIAENYSEEKLNLRLEEELIPPGKAGDIEKVAIKLVEYLNQFTGNPVKVDSLDTAVWLKAETQNLQVDVYLTPKPAGDPLGGS